MEFIKILISAVLIACNLLVASDLARFHTEFRKPLFSVKPFTCGPCLTFWYTLIGGFIVAACLGWHWAVAVVAAAGMAFFNYYRIKALIKIEP